MEKLKLAIKFQNRQVSSYRFISFKQSYLDLLELIFKTINDATAIFNITSIFFIFLVPYIDKTSRHGMFYMLILLCFACLNISLLIVRSLLILKIDLPSTFLSYAFMFFVSVIIIIETSPFLLQRDVLSSDNLNFLNTSYLSSTVFLLLFIFYYFFSTTIQKLKLTNIINYLIIPIVFFTLIIQNPWYKVLINITILSASISLIRKMKIHYFYKLTILAFTSIILYTPSIPKFPDIYTNAIFLMPVCIFQLIHSRNEIFKSINFIFLVFVIKNLFYVDKVFVCILPIIITFLLYAILFLYRKKNDFRQLFKKQINQNKIKISKKDLTLLLVSILTIASLTFIFLDIILGKNQVIFAITSQLQNNLYYIYNAPKDLTWFLGGYHTTQLHSNIILQIFENFGLIGIWSSLLLISFYIFRLKDQTKAKTKIQTLISFCIVSILISLTIYDWNFQILFILVVYLCLAAIHITQSSQIKINSDTAYKFLFPKLANKKMKLVIEVIRLSLILGIMILGFLVIFLLINNFLS